MQQRQLTFTEAVQKAIVENYCNFTGRASRSEFWWFALFGVILGFAINLITTPFGEKTTLILSGIINLALLLPSLGLNVRRLHDINKSGWYILLYLIPLVGLILMIVWGCKESDPHPNNYGPEPNVE